MPHQEWWIQEVCLDLILKKYITQVWRYRSYWEGKTETWLRVWNARFFKKSKAMSIIFSFNSLLTLVVLPKHKSIKELREKYWLLSLYKSAPFADYRFFSGTFALVKSGLIHTGTSGQMKAELSTFRSLQRRPFSLEHIYFWYPYLIK